MDLIDDVSKDVRVCINYNDPSTKLVLKLLKDAGFNIRSIAASGVSQPRVITQSGTYEGMKQIRQLVISHC